jgi:hypothetical protein
MQNNSPLASRTRWHFHWILPLLIRPRATLTSIAEAIDGVWQTPMLLLGLSGLLRTLVVGSLQAAAAASGEIALPPGFEYYTPEQQAQFMQAATATNSPVFVYVLPALMGLAGLFVAWLLLGWLLHLVLTLMGGRNSNQQILNLTAWAMLPLLLRDVVQTMVMAQSGQVLTGVGLSGLVVADGAVATAYLAAVLSQLDVYLLWQMGLLLLGAKVASTLSWGKVWLGVAFSLLLLLMLRALPALAGAMLGDLTVVQPFF